MRKAKFLLTTFLLIVLFLFIQLLIAKEPLPVGDLGCDDLTLCTGSASCGGPGHELETCHILCFDSCEINCPKRFEN